MNQNQLFENHENNNGEEIFPENFDERRREDDEDFMADDFAAMNRENNFEDEEEEIAGNAENQRVYQDDYRGNNDDYLFDDELLYDDAPLTIRESMLLLVSISIKHNLTESCLSDIIDAVNLHCRRRNFRKNSLYKLKKYFDLSDIEYKKHYYCSVCQSPLEAANDQCQSCEQNEVSYFIELPFLQQLTEMYCRNGF